MNQADFLKSTEGTASHLMEILPTLDPAHRNRMFGRAFDEVMHEFRLTHLRLVANGPEKFCTPILAKIQYAEECAKMYIKEVHPLRLCRMIAALELLQTARQSNVAAMVRGYEFAWDTMLFDATRQLISIVSQRAMGCQLNG